MGSLNHFRLAFVHITLKSVINQSEKCIYKEEENER